MVAAGPVANPIWKKIESEHIDKVLDHANESSKREDAQQSFSKKLVFASFVITIALIVFLVLALDDAILPEILSLIGGLVAGFLGGFGIGRST